MTELKPDNTALLATVNRTNLGIFISWLKDLGGEYIPFFPEPEKKVHTSDEPRKQYRLNPKYYFTDKHGSVRRISERGKKIADKLGI
jgi:hypothetical protein